MWISRTLDFWLQFGEKSAAYTDVYKIPKVVKMM